MDSATHCLCVVREDEPPVHGALAVRRPSGAAALLGRGRPRRRDDGSLRFVPLRELQPYHWTRAYPPETLERYGEPNEQRRPKNTKTSFYCAAGTVKSTGKAAPACTEAAFGFYAIFI